MQVSKPAITSATAAKMNILAICDLRLNPNDSYPLQPTVSGKKC